jgi:hypothetical protein
MRLAWRQLLPMRAPHCALQGGVAGIIRAQGKAQRPCVTFEADRHALAVQPRPQCGAPRLDRLGRVRTLEALALCRASRLEASIMVGIRPVDPNKGRQGGV